MTCEGQKAWTAGMDERMLELKGAGYSANETAVRLNIELGLSLSRNAVIGRLSRIRATPEQRRQWVLAGQHRRLRKPPANPRRAPRPPRLPRLPRMTTRIAPVFIAERPQSADWRGIEIWQLTETTCRFPSPESPFTYCGDPSAEVNEGRPYCEYHMRLTHSGFRYWGHPRYTPGGGAVNE